MHKKLHGSLIQNKRLSKSINNILHPQSINNILHPRTQSPMSLYDTKGNLTSDPAAMCRSMEESLTSLGGPPNFDVDNNFIDTLMARSPELPNDAPLPQFARKVYDHLLYHAKP